MAAMLLLLSVFSIEDSHEVSTIKDSGRPEDTYYEWKYEASEDVRFLSVSKYGNIIVAGIRPDTICIFSGHGEITQIWEAPDNIVSISTSDDGTIISAATARTLYVLDQTGKTLWTYTSGEDIAQVEVSKDDRFLALGTINKVIFFEITSHKLWECNIGTSPGYDLLSLSPNARYIAASGGRLIHLIDNNGTVLWTYDQPIALYNLFIIDNRPRVAFTTYKLDTVFLSQDDKVIRTIEDDYDAGLDGIAFSGDGRFVAVKSISKAELFQNSENIILSWERRIDTLDAHHNLGENLCEQTIISITDDGNYIVSGTKKGGIFVYDNSGNLLFEIPSERVDGLCVSDELEKIVVNSGSTIYCYSREYLEKIDKDEVYSEDKDQEGSKQEPDQQSEKENGVDQIFQNIISSLKLITSGIWNFLYQNRLSIGFTIYILDVLYNIKEYLRARREGLHLPRVKIILLILGSFPLFIDLFRPKR